MRSCNILPAPCTENLSRHPDRRPTQTHRGSANFPHDEVPAAVACVRRGRSYIVDCTSTERSEQRQVRLRSVRRKRLYGCLIAARYTSSRSFDPGPHTADCLKIDRWQFAWERAADTDPARNTGRTTGHGEQSAGCASSKAMRSRECAARRRSFAPGGSSRLRRARHNDALIALAIVRQCGHHLCATFALLTCGARHNRSSRTQRFSKPSKHH